MTEWGKNINLILYNLQSHLILGWPLLDVEFHVHIFGASSHSVRAWVGSQEKRDIHRYVRDIKQLKKMTGAVRRRFVWRHSACRTMKTRPVTDTARHRDCTLTNSCWTLFRIRRRNSNWLFITLLTRLFFSPSTLRKEGFAPFLCNELKFSRYDQSDDTLSKNKSYTSNFSRVRCWSWCSSVHRLRGQISN